MIWHTVISQPFALGESPFWQASGGVLYGVDVAGRKLWRTMPGSGYLDRWDMPAEPGCIAPARSGGALDGWIVVLRDRICRATDWGGTLHDIARLPIDPAI